jgi:hypothetical protein
VGHTDRSHLEIIIFQDGGNISVIHVHNCNVTVSGLTNRSAKNGKCAVGAIEHSIQERRNVWEKGATGWSRYFQWFLPSEFAQPQQCRKVGHVVWMKVANRQKHEIVESSSRLTESKERTSSCIDHHDRAASAPYQVAAGRPIRTRERPTGPENLNSSCVGATSLSNDHRSDWLYRRPAWATPSCLKFRELLEMRIVVSEIESMLLCARKDQQIGQGDGHTGSPSAIRQPNSAVPHRG